MVRFTYGEAVIYKGLLYYYGGFDRIKRQVYLINPRSMSDIILPSYLVKAIGEATLF